MKAQETRKFKSEVKQLLNLMIHSLYSNKEIFLRELISNASDAAEKLRFQALSTPNIYEKDKDIHVRISIDKDKRTLIVNDNAIGMSRKELIENLGTIAKSGTKSFIQSIEPQKVSKISELIGQFGVGFYSTFMIADKVTVRSRAAGAAIDEAVLWESTGEGSYTIADIKKNHRGTEITLHLRESEDEFLNPWRLREIIRKYSDYIDLPIEMKSVNKEDNWEKVNQAHALWIKNKSDISEIEYKDFYKHITHDVHDPMIWSHNRVEGKHEYTSLLYIPSHAALNLWNRDYKSSLKLYVQRIFITDDINNLIPNYFRFVHGLIDCKNLSLNISREILPHNSVVQKLRAALTKRVFQMLQKLMDDPNKYNKFWQTFGLVLKEGPAEDNDNIKNIMPLLRFASTHSKDSTQTVSLQEYVNRMISNQEKIYYITADSYAAASNSPHLEVLRKKGIEILLLYDRIDEWMMSYLTSFEGKSFHSVSKIDESLNKLINDKDSKLNTNNTSLQSFIVRVKKILKNKVQDVRLTNRLIETPAILTTEANEMSTQMAKIFAAAGQKVPKINYILELNPEHPLIKKATKTIDDTSFIDLIELLLDQALLTEIGSLEDPNKFIRRVNNLIIKSNVF